MVIIEIIFVIICVFYLIRLSLPWIIRFLITRLIKKVSKEKKFNNFYQTNSSKTKNKKVSKDKNFNNFYQTNSSKTKNKKVNNPDKDVEYIDYEEID